MTNEKKMIKELKKKSKRTLKNERQDILDKQEFLRKKKEELDCQKERLYESLLTIKKSDKEEKKEEQIDLIENQIKIVKDAIASTVEEYKTNTEALELYSKVLKNDREANAASINATVGIVSGLGALGLGALSLKKAYQSDTEGTMNNKKTLDVFNRLNPLRILGKK